MKQIKLPNTFKADLTINEFLELKRLSELSDKEKEIVKDAFKLLGIKPTSKAAQILNNQNKLK